MAAVAAPGTWYGVAEKPEKPAAATERFGFEIPGQSFPGSAFYYVQPSGTASAARDDQAASSHNPDQAAALAGPAARPFHMAGTALSGARAQQCLTMAVYYEAASESDSGQRAVAQVVLNRVAHPAYPDTVCGVVFQGSERRTGCQFTFTCDGSLARKPARLWWDRAEKVAVQALAGTVYAPVGLATHYHTVQVHPYWAGSLTPAGAIGMHQFYRWQGAAGRPASFSELYRGHEPLPGKPAAAANAPAPDPAELAREWAQPAGEDSASMGQNSTASTSINGIPERNAAPVYSQAIRERGGDRLFVGDLPSASQVKPEYATSGQWIAKP
ncbi:cell wall hydrolase [Altericroceibacterium spongiae]|uniref:Cell wall hydrolase n=2 Tax=Altericroceibacterium spongiae TaxID=2320269 RepID=A0A420EN14_9SPHN|nr:cell wall hydrolase [Altericroceibacterium spongiae]